MSFKAQYSSAIFLWIISAVFLVAIYLFIFWIFPSISKYISIFGLAILFLIGIYLPLFIKSISYKISGNSIISKYGVIFAFWEVLRLDEVIYISFVKTPYSRFTGLNFVILNACGQKSVLLFLSTDDCDKIRKALCK